MIKPRHFLTLLDRTPEELQNLINTAIKLKEERQKGIKHRGQRCIEPEAVFGQIKCKFPILGYPLLDGRPQAPV